MRRRRSALMVSLALAGSMLGLIPVSASAVPPGDTPETGNFYVDPTSFSEGQSVKLTANFPSGSFLVTFYKQTAPDTWTSIGTDQSNSYGNAVLSSYQVNGTQDVYARITSGAPAARTEVKTLTPLPPGVIAPTGPDTGNLTESPTTFVNGDLISVTANFPDGTFPITLYKEGPVDTWTAVATKTSSSSGNATFSGFPVTSTTQRIFARKANNDRTEVDDITPKPEVTLSIRRDCTGNDCAMTATARGALDPAQAGRVVKLQYKSGDTWKTVGSSATTGADGTVAITFSLSGVSQWSPRTYRLSVASSGSNPSLLSNQIKFMPGPTKLGVNILRVDVEDGIFPTIKGPEYPAKATLSENGAVTHQSLKVEEFGVRGHSSVKYTKKPYKLKFLDKPPKDSNGGTKTVFGMERAKSWTLLANWVDQSLIRNKVGLDLGRRMTNIAWTPDSRFVEMFVNDQYRGAYLMTESVKIDGDRVDVDPVTGMIMETDGSTVEDSLLGFMSTIGKIAFAFKDPDEVKSGADVEEGVTPAKLNAVRNRINAFEDVVYNAATRAQHPDFIDVPSAIDFHLVKEFTKDHDAAFWRSHYFWWDPVVGDDKFHFGPAWDFDAGAGQTRKTDAVNLYLASPEGWYMRGTGTSSGDPTYRTHWFVQLFKDPAFEAAVKARWALIRSEFQQVHQVDVEADKAAVGIGAENDRLRWASEPKTQTPRASYSAEVAFVKDWYAKRFAWMDAQLSN